MKKIDQSKYDAATICGYASDDTTFTDNMHGHCDGCGKAIMWRPHSPHGERVLMVCVQCGLEGIQEMRDAGEEPEIMVTRKAMEDATKVWTGDSNKGFWGGIIDEPAADPE